MPDPRRGQVLTPAYVPNTLASIYGHAILDEVTQSASRVRPRSEGEVMIEIQPQHVTVDQLFYGRLFRIPQYQRTYSWHRKQRQDLLEDIRRTWAAGKERLHFMATIVGLRRETRTIMTKKLSQNLNHKCIDRFLGRFVWFLQKHREGPHGETRDARDHLGSTG